MWEVESALGTPLVDDMMVAPRNEKAWMSLGDGSTGSEVLKYDLQADERLLENENENLLKRSSRLTH